MIEKRQATSGTSILVVDDDQDFRWAISNVLEAAGYQTREAENGKAALETLEKDIPNLILLDNRMPGETGIKIAKRILKRIPGIPIIVITAYAEVKDVVVAMKMGIYDYVTKPIDNSDLIFTIKRALEKQELAHEVEKLKNILSERGSLYEQMGSSDQIKRVVNLVEKVAPTSFTVLIEGESGTGKEIVARATHDLSEVRDGPFVAVDCGAIPETLIESELFGYMKGAFTGAHADKPGQFELAEGGTIFLDEAGNLPYPAQQKLLRAMQERRVQRLGAKKSISVEVRVVAATNVSLDKYIEKGKFRADLYYRLNEFAIRLPSLNERKSDIPYLSKMFMDKACIELKKECSGFSKEAFSNLLSYNWPGNVRELRNIVRQAVLLCEEAGTIKPGHLMLDDGIVQSQSAETTSDILPHIYKDEGSLKETLKHHTDQLEKKIIKQILEDTKGNKSKAARELRIDYKTLLRKIKAHQIE